MKQKIIDILEKYAVTFETDNYTVGRGVSDAQYDDVADEILRLITPIEQSSDVVVCPSCGGENEYFKRENGYQCAFTDCKHEWTD